MLFNSYIFIFAFLPIALGGFFAASHLGRRAAGCWLIAASLFFYGWWNPSFTPLLITSIVGNYAAARLLYRLSRYPRRQNGVLALAIAANLAALIHYKYLAAIFGFLRVHGISDIAFTDPILPLGISLLHLHPDRLSGGLQQGLGARRATCSTTSCSSPSSRT